MAALPALAPSSMSFTAPEFPVRANMSLSGVTSRRIFGNRGAKASLELGFNNIPDATAATFMDSWNASRGTLDVVTVPPVVFDGADAALTSYMADGGDALAWHFAAPPQLDRVKPGYSSVRVNLEATRDA